MSINEEVTTVLIICSLFASVVIGVSLIGSCQIKVNEQIISLIGKGMTPEDARCTLGILSCQPKGAEKKK